MTSSPGPGRIVVVGLGPAGADLLTPQARTALEGAGRRFTRTARHPAVEELRAAGLSFHSFDAVYEGAADLESVYVAIVAELVTASAGAYAGAVVYAVPGNPAVAERTVALLRDEAHAGRVHLDLVPGLSFADLAWARLGVDPMEHGARVVDGRTLELASVDLGVPLLIAQCDTRLVLSDVKLTLLDRLDPATPVDVLHHLGLPDERVVRLPLGELDRDGEPDHLTTVFVPAAPASAAAEVGRLLALAERLRGPGGCPWDAAQTHHSLVRHLLEESYEVADALEALPAGAPDGIEGDDPRYAAVLDELGDLLFQVVIHTVLAQETGAFTMADVARGIHDKLVRRHPHVFGEVEVAGPDDVVANWEQIKQQERGSASLLDGVTSGLPGLLLAHTLLRRAASVGVDVDPAGPQAAIADALARLDAPGSASGEPHRDPAEVEVAFGDLLAGVVALARHSEVDAESALRGWASRFRAGFAARESSTSPA